MTNHSDSLQSDAQRLYELNRLFVKAVVESDRDELQRVVPEYIKIKKRLRSNLMGSPAVRVNDSNSLSVLQKLAEDTIYGETSSLVHGSKTITSKEARDAFRETLRIVHLLYNHHTVDI